MKKLRKMTTYLLPIAILATITLFGCAVDGVDTTAPTAVLMSPADAATDVAITSNITITFSEAMDASTITGTTFALTQGATEVPGSVSYNETDMTATFNPTSDLMSSTEYTATITTGALDVIGNPFAANEVWSFTTAAPGVDSNSPTVIGTVPASSATGVAITADITATFSETMDSATIIAANFTLNGGTEVAGTITYTDATATFNPTSNLAYSTVYTATITTGAKDVAGNPLAANKVWTFTTSAETDSTAPTVVSTFPADSATEVSINTNITTTFSEAMDPTTILATSFTLNDGTDVAGAVTYDIGNMKAVFSPNENLSANTTYTATITTTVTDSEGNQLVSAEVFTFTTISVLGDGPAPVSLRTAGNFVILAKTGVSTVPASAVTGNLGLSPSSTSYITGFSLTDSTGYATSPQVTGFIYAADMATPTPTNMTAAISDMETAFTDAAGRSTPDFTDLGTGEIGGMTLVPGLYKWGTGVSITTDVTLNGGANDVWIFQITEGLTVASGAQVILNGGALPKNIFWQMAGDATLNTTSHMEGIILSQTAINLSNGASVNGRLLAQTAVSLDQNAVTQPAQ